MNDSDAEEWRVVEGWPYEVSSFGRIRRIGGSVIRPTRQKSNMRYFVVTLYRGNRGTARQFYLHHLVCLAFRGPRPSPLHQTRHGDGDVRNCRAGNLHWGTPLENQSDRRMHGTDPRGERNGRSVLSASLVAELRSVSAAVPVDDRSARYGFIKALADKHGVDRNTIMRAISGQRWNG
jgi:hypothetical protein